MKLRSVRRSYRAVRDDIGDLVTQRPLPNSELDQIDPFLFLNHHGPQVYPPGNRGLPFGPHPHRGFETVTFILQGSLAHHDTGGNQSVIDGGGVQWMTAGRGVEHSELSPREFMERGGPLEILQLWVNLPARLKMSDPRYIGLQRDDIPAFESDDAFVRLSLIAGEWNGVRGPVESLTAVQMMMIDMKSDGAIEIPAGAERNVFCYVVRGELRIGGAIISAFHLADFDVDGDAIRLEARSDAFVLFGHADPIGEPVVSHGPFVMNSREEIVQAIRDYHAGLFR